MGLFLGPHKRILAQVEIHEVLMQCLYTCGDVIASQIKANFPPEDVFVTVRICDFMKRILMLEMEAVA